MTAKQEQDKLEKYLSSAGKLVSVGTGIGIDAMVTTLTMDPVTGSMVGNFAENTISRVWTEVVSGLLSNREKSRVISVSYIAKCEVEQKIRNGESVRQDGFFDSNQYGRSDAEEVVENVLLKCQKEPQEKKIRFMGYLLANLVFRSDISVDMAHQIINYAEELTYRQLCLLRIATCRDVRKLRDSDYREQKLYPNGPYDILHECSDLFDKEFISLGEGSFGGVTNIRPAKMRTQGMGRLIHDLMNLDRVPHDDLDSVANHLM